MKKNIKRRKRTFKFPIRDILAIIGFSMFFVALGGIDSLIEEDIMIGLLKFLILLTISILLIVLGCYKR